jgi:hypothetical protein
MADQKHKDYCIYAFCDTVKTHNFLVFNYDQDFFFDILENLTDGEDKSLSFPVHSDFFDLYRYKEKHTFKGKIDLETLEKNKFCHIEKFRKVIDPSDVVDTARLYVYDNTFHFAVKTVYQFSYSTLDFDAKFIKEINTFSYRNALVPA